MIEKIQKLLNDNGCERLVMSSAYSEIIPALERMDKFNDVIEIGTHNGLTTAVLTNYCRRVFTFDIALRNSEYIWDLLEVRNKISSYVCGSPDAIRSEIEYIKREWNDLNFDLTFIDGDHDYYSVKNDFEMVKFCGRVLLHDSNSNPGVKVFCDEMKIKNICENIAYWEAS